MNEISMCPGCGVVGDREAFTTFTSCNASPYCWKRYNELLMYTLSLGDEEFMHQHAIDAYAAQHSGGNTRPIQICFALIGLYLYLNHGYSGRKIQRAHRKLAERTKEWPILTHAHPIPDITVIDVLQSEPGKSRNQHINEWANSVWNEWALEHIRVASWCEQLLFT